jgi:hypothetical protein
MLLGTSHYPCHPATDAPELEIALFRNGTGYAIDMRFQAGADCTALVLARAQVLDLCFEALLEAALNIEQYGARLTAMLFCAESARAAWRHARVYADAYKLPLRVRLRLDHQAPEVHTLCWEALQNPDTGSFLCLDERVLFTRYIDSYDVLPPHIPPRSQLSSLIAVASPTNLPSYGLAHLDVEGEVRQARAALDFAPLTVLDGRAGRPRATLAALIEHLSAGQHILYLVCHGTTVDGETYLWLEDEHGAAARCSAHTLALRIEQLLHRPVFIMLAACQTAGRLNEQRATLPLGTMLARAGIAAVLVMNGTMPVATLQQMMPVLFRTLYRHGHIDHALTIARTTASADSAWWRPVLWTRIRSGQIWRDQRATAPLHAGGLSVASV